MIDVNFKSITILLLLGTWSTHTYAQTSITQPSTTQLPTTQLPTTQLPTTQLPTTQFPTTQFPTTQFPIPQLLIPNYDNAELKLKVFDDRYRDPLILSCNITVAGNYTLRWTRNGTLVSEDPQLQGRYQIIDVEHKLIISPTMEEDAGVYTCSVPELLESHDFNVVANVYFKFNPPNVYLIEGERLQIHCLAYGTDPEIRWTVGNQTFNESSGHIILQPDWKGIENAILVIESVTYADRKVYNCTATNLAVKYGNVGYEEAVESTLVRIREKMAPLWPVCGIACEVVLLFLIFFIYEKTRDKEESDEVAYARDFVENRHKQK